MEHIPSQAGRIGQSDGMVRLDCLSMSEGPSNRLAGDPTVLISNAGVWEVILESHKKSLNIKAHAKFRRFLPNDPNTAIG